MAPKTKQNAAKSEKLQPAKAKKLKAKPKSPDKKDKSKSVAIKGKKVVKISNEASSVSVKLAYKSFKEIDSNKYASKAQRAAVMAACNIGVDDDIHVCNCTKKCDLHCHNRQLYM